LGVERGGGAPSSFVNSRQVLSRIPLAVLCDFKGLPGEKGRNRLLSSSWASVVVSLEGNEASTEKATG
jgi:hypothetical protein